VNNTHEDQHGQASLLRDLLKLRSTFAFRRYRVDVIGFIVAWLFVLAFIAFYWFLSKWT
jgi:hypothetical protein